MKSRLVQVADIGVTFYSTCALYYVGIVRERVMARRLIVALMSVAIMIGFVSCDLSTAMRAMGNNVAGANPGNINNVNTTIDTIWGTDGSGGKTSIESGEIVSIGNIELPSSASTGVTAMLSPLNTEDLSDLVSSIAKASASDSSKKALQNSLSEPLDTETEDGQDKKEATQGSATIIKNMIIDMTDSAADISASDLENKLLGDEDMDMDPTIRTLFGNLIDGVYAISTGEGETGESVDITKGDLVIMQTVYTVVGNVSETIFDNTATVGEDEMPPMRDFSEMTSNELSGLIDQLNMGIQVIDAVAPASKFGNIQLQDLMKDLLESMNNNSEGGSN